MGHEWLVILVGFGVGALLIGMFGFALLASFLDLD
jgi:hypothetical protein